MEPGKNANDRANMLMLSTYHVHHHSYHVSNVVFANTRCSFKNLNRCITYFSIPNLHSANLLLQKSTAFPSETEKPKYNIIYQNDLQ